MENNKGLGNREVWISYINDDGQIIQGFFILVEESINYVKIKSGSNILTIPFGKINKIKEKIIWAASNPCKHNAPKCRPETHFEPFNSIGT